MLCRNSSGTVCRQKIPWGTARDHPGAPHLEPGTGLSCPYATVSSPGEALLLTAGSGSLPQVFHPGQSPPG